jgi:hypothetical protein
VQVADSKGYRELIDGWGEAGVGTESMGAALRQYEVSKAGEDDGGTGEGTSVGVCADSTEGVDDGTTVSGVLDTESFWEPEAEGESPRGILRVCNLPALDSGTRARDNTVRSHLPLQVRVRFKDSKAEMWEEGWRELK